MLHYSSKDSQVKILLATLDENGDNSNKEGDKRPGGHPLRNPCHVVPTCPSHPPAHKNLEIEMRWYFLQKKGKVNKISTCPPRNPQCSDPACTTPPPGKSIGLRWSSRPPAMGRSSCEIKGLRQFNWREHKDSPAALPFTANSEMNRWKIWKWIKKSLNSLLRHLPPMLQETWRTY